MPVTDFLFARMQPLPPSFFGKKQVAYIAQQLLGKLLCTRSLQGSCTIGRITETEAYGGVTDKASHAYGGRRTTRTEIMYAQGGYAYVYLCYGMHHLFNVVTGKEGEAEAVLIRALQPVFGEALMWDRRPKARSSAQLTSGPGALSQALGIHTGLSGISLQSARIWLADDGYRYAPKRLRVTPRIGIPYAEEDTYRPWRFLI